MRISNFLLQLELEVCQASRLLTVFCKGKGHGFTTVGRNGLFPYLQDRWMAVQQNARHCTQWAKSLQQHVQVDQPCCPWQLLWMFAQRCPSLVALASCRQVWLGCLQMLQGEGFVTAWGGLSCFILELGEEASFPCMESTALHVTITPAAEVYLVDSRAEHAIRAHSAPCAARVTCPKHYLRGCVGSLLSSVPGLRPVCWDYHLAGRTGCPQRLKAQPSHLICQTSLSSYADDISLFCIKAGAAGLSAVSPSLRSDVPYW